MYKLRNIAFQKSGDPVKGLTCPNEIAVFFENTFFSVKKSGDTIVFTSGTQQTITKQQIEEYNYEDCRV